MEKMSSCDGTTDGAGERVSRQILVANIPQLLTCDKLIPYLISKFSNGASCQQSKGVVAFGFTFLCDFDLVIIQGSAIYMCSPCDCC